MAQSVTTRSANNPQLPNIKIYCTDSVESYIPKIELPEVNSCDIIPKKLAKFLKKSPSLPPRKRGYELKADDVQPKKSHSSSCLEGQDNTSLVPLISSGSYKLSPKQGASLDIEVLTNGNLLIPVTSQPRNSAGSLKVRFDTDVEVHACDGHCQGTDSLPPSDGVNQPGEDGQVRTHSRASTCTVCSFSGPRDLDDLPQIEDEGSEEDELKPPDGGYGWVIVFASFLIHLIADGITFSFGVIFTELLDYFKESRGKTAWIASLFMSLPLFAGPVASSVTDRFGCKAVTIAGGLISAFGFVLSSMTDSIEVMFITFGVIPGLGLSFCYVAAIASVAYYFEARRSLAIGLAVCGSGLGTFVFAPITQALLDEYGWRGTTLILAGVFLNLCVCGMLMRELETTSQRREMRRRQRYTSQTESITGSVVASIRPDIEDIDDVTKGVPEDIRMCTSLISLPTFVRNGEKVPLEVLEPLLSDPSLYSILMHLNPKLIIGRSFEDQVNVDCVPKMISVTSQPEVEMMQHEHKVKNGWVQNSLVPKSTVLESCCDEKPHEKMKSNHVQQQKPLPTHLLKSIRVNKKMLTHRCAMLNLPLYRLRASSCPDLYRNSMVTLAASSNGACGGILGDLQVILLDMCDVSNLANAKFLLFLFSNFLLYAWYDVPYIYLVDSALQRGISKEKASFLSSMIGIVNTFGGVLLGFLGDKPWVDPHLTYAVLMCLCGIATGIIPLLKSYEAIAAAAGLFGGSIAANYSLTAIILVDLLSLDKFTNAYGLVLLLQGIGNLIGPPLAGWIFDETGDYDLSFYVAGAFVILSGVILIVSPVYNAYKKYVLRTSTKGTEI